MIRTCFAISLLIVAVVADTYGQRAPKRVKQPREVIEAYQVCAEFRRLLAEDLDFDRAFEATFVRDAARRREIALAEIEPEGLDLSKLDDATLLGIYKDQSQLLLLALPLFLLENPEQKAELIPPAIEEIGKRRRPKDSQELNAFAAQLKRDVADFRAHFEKLAANNSAVAESVREFKKLLLQPADPPQHVVKPLTAYGRGRVLPPNAKYYRIDDCSVIREAGKMKIIGMVFFRIRG